MELIIVTARGGNSELETIQDRYMTCLRTFIEHTNSQQVTRFQNLLDRLPEVRTPIIEYWSCCPDICMISIYRKFFAFGLNDADEIILHEVLPWANIRDCC